MRIVVIEDEDNTRYGIMNLIGKIGTPYEVVGDADNGEDGLALIERLRPDLVITDIKMPQFSGIEMLESLKRKGHRHQTVILTGFSQYEYAKKAFGLGVLAFLEKPITAADLKETLEKADEELKLQQMAGLPRGDAAGRLEHYLQQALSNDRLDLSLIAPLAEQAAGLRADRPHWVVSAYVGAAFEDQSASLKAAMESALAQTGRYSVFAVPFDRSVVALFDPFDPIDLNEINENGEVRSGDRSAVGISLEQAIRQAFPQAGIVETRIDGLQELCITYRKQRTERKWLIPLNESSGVLQADIPAARQSEALPFPQALENKILAAVQDRKLSEIDSMIKEWELLCFEGRHDPRHIIDGSVRLVSSLLRAIGETYGDEPVFRYQTEWLEPILTAQTRSELNDAFARIAHDAASLDKTIPQAPAYSYVVQRAVRLIHNRYGEGISLDEIATSLNITPEYLSGLFAKEVGSNFSAYMKQIRVGEAKRLLLTTGLKMFEIAKTVGYPDPKYFSRVFKEVTGLSPAEYQKVHPGKA
ncbi:response regulator [Paenibacillus sp. NPDC058071]|uniref:response regulator n=1 Tax=Paenibacillus sp. NPDC058071 TaxID=3346326 RepID=UPI0036DB8BD8